MKLDKPGLASNSYIYPRDLPRTEKLSDSEPHFEDPDIFVRSFLLMLDLNKTCRLGIFSELWNSVTLGLSLDSCWIDFKSNGFDISSYDNDLQLFEYQLLLCNWRKIEEYWLSFYRFGKSRAEADLILLLDQMAWVSKGK